MTQKACKNCRYYKYDPVGRYSVYIPGHKYYLCTHHWGITYKSEPIGGTYKIYTDCYTARETYCKDAANYRRKWWKIWEDK